MISQLTSNDVADVLLFGEYDGQLHIIGTESGIDLFNNLRYEHGREIERYDFFYIDDKEYDIIRLFVRCLTKSRFSDEPFVNIESLKFLLDSQAIRKLPPLYFNAAVTAAMNEHDETEFYNYAEQTTKKVIFQRI